MGIIINDFEITVDPPQKGTETKQGNQEAPAAQTELHPEDIVRIERHFRERRRRVLAN